MIAIKKLITVLLVWLICIWPLKTDGSEAGRIRGLIHGMRTEAGMPLHGSLKTKIYADGVDPNVGERIGVSLLDVVDEAIDPFVYRRVLVVLTNLSDHSFYRMFHWLDASQRESALRSLVRIMDSQPSSLEDLPKLLDNLIDEGFMSLADVNVNSLTPEADEFLAKLATASEELNEVGLYLVGPQGNSAITALFTKASITGGKRGLFSNLKGSLWELDILIYHIDGLGLKLRSAGVTVSHRLSEPDFPDGRELDLVFWDGVDEASTIAIEGKARKTWVFDGRPAMTADNIRDSARIAVRVIGQSQGRATIDLHEFYKVQIPALPSGVSLKDYLGADFVKELQKSFGLSSRDNSWENFFEFREGVREIINGREYVFLRVGD